MLNRRNVLVFGAASLVSLATPAVAKGMLRLDLFRPRTRERLVAEFSARSISKDSYAKLNWLLRDVSAKQAMPMDRDLLVLAAQLSEDLHVEQLHVQSGYRTKGTNGAIRGAAKKSYHMKGMALDIKVPGLSTRAIAQAARKAGAGGVGRYPARGFVHIDTGPTRAWTK